MRSRTTLQDFGRGSQKYGDIPWFNLYPYRLYFEKDYVIPHDVYTWCKNNCKGYYRVQCYTHISSTDKKPVVYVHVVYLQDEGDAALLRLHSDVTPVTVERKEKAISKATAKRQQIKATQQKQKTNLSPAQRAWITRRENGWIHPSKRKKGAKIKKSQKISKSDLSKRALAAWATRRANGWVHPNKKNST